MTTHPVTESDYDTEFTIRITMDVPVLARTTEEAKSKAGMYVPHPAKSVGTPKVMNRNWKPLAESMLQSGMSHAEIGKTLGIDRSTVSRAFPNTGWTREEGGHVAQLKRKIAEYERRLKL